MADSEWRLVNVRGDHILLLFAGQRAFKAGPHKPETRIVRFGYCSEVFYRIR